MATRLTRDSAFRENSAPGNHSGDTADSVHRREPTTQVPWTLGLRYRPHRAPAANTGPPDDGSPPSSPPAGPRRAGLSPGAPVPRLAGRGHVAGGPSCSIRRDSARPRRGRRGEGHAGHVTLGPRGCFSGPESCRVPGTPTTAAVRVGGRTGSVQNPGIRPGNFPVGMPVRDGRWSVASGTPRLESGEKSVTSVGTVVGGMRAPRAPGSPAAVPSAPGRCARRSACRGPARRRPHGPRRCGTVCRSGRPVSGRTTTDRGSY